MYVFRRSEPQLWTVGYYDPKGKWRAMSDHDTPEKAAAEINFLNGGERRQAA